MEVERDSSDDEGPDAVHGVQAVVHTRSRRLRAAKARRESLKRVMLQANGWDISSEDEVESED